MVDWSGILVGVCWLEYMEDVDDEQADAETEGADEVAFMEDDDEGSELDDE